MAPIKMKTSEGKLTESISLKPLKENCPAEKSGKSDKEHQTKEANKNEEVVDDKKVKEISTEIELEALDELQATNYITNLF